MRFSPVAFFKAIGIAISLFFVLYLFAPNTAYRFLGVSFRDRDLVKVVQNLDLDAAETRNLRRLLTDSEIRKEFKSAAEKGVSVLSSYTEELEL